MTEKTLEERVAELEQEVQVLRRACGAAGALKLGSATARNYPPPAALAEVEIVGTKAIRDALEG